MCFGVYVRIAQMPINGVICPGETFEIVTKFK